jgi:NAD(P)-dependent dehydrogenase (short-subunit alcohol dehydrogenase family)
MILSSSNISKDNFMSNIQSPIGSGFGAASTAADVIRNIDLSGKTAIVTGGYSGLGLETARVLADAGAQVVIPARDIERARRSTAHISNAEIHGLDLMEPVSINSFAEWFLAKGRALDILVNNAGIMATPLLRDGRGNEAQFSTNHLGHFQLTMRLWPALAKANKSRVVSVSSGGHRIAPVDFDDINFETRPYDKWIAYGQSKTANVLFAVGLDERGKQDGIRAFALHPGSVLGPLARHLSPEEIATFNVHDENGNVIVAPERDLKTTKQGASTAVWCATSALIEDIGGVYCENCDIASITPEDGSTTGGVNPWAIDRLASDRLWDVSEAMTGIANK